VVRQVLVTAFCISISGVSSIINEVLSPLEAPMEVQTPRRGKSPIWGRFPNYREVHSFVPGGSAL